MHSDSLASHYYYMDSYDRQWLTENYSSQATQKHDQKKCTIQQKMFNTVCTWKMLLFLSITRSNSFN